MVHAEIAGLLSENSGYRDASAPLPTAADLAELEGKLGVELPIEYREFVTQGGLADLRFMHRVLEPAEIQANYHLVRAHGLVPIASNGCGDLFCISSARTAEVVLWHHDTGSRTPVHENLLAALRAWRF